MKKWFSGNEVTGWTSIDIQATGVYGVTVLPPATVGQRPCVVKSGFLPVSEWNAAGLIQLSEQISVAGCPWVLTLSRDQYTLLVIPEPRVHTDELEQSIRYSIDETVGFSVAEDSLALMKIPVDAAYTNNTPHIYVVLVKRETMREIDSVFQDAGLKLSQIDIRETAQRNISLQVQDLKQGVALLFIEEQGVALTVSSHGALYLDRFIKTSAFMEAVGRDAGVERIDSRISLELQRSFDFVARKYPFLQIERVFIMTSGSVPTDISPLSFDLPFERLELARMFDFSQTPALSNEKIQPDYFIALGAALRYCENYQSLNLQNRMAGYRPRAILAELCVLASLILLLGLFWGEGQLALEQVRSDYASSELNLQKIRVRINEMNSSAVLNQADNPVLTTLREAAAKTILAQARHLGNADGYARYFTLLTDVEEKGVWLTSVVIESGKSVALSGRASDQAALLRYVKKLNTAFVLYDVQFTQMELNAEVLPAQSEARYVFFKLHCGKG